MYILSSAHTPSTLISWLVGLVGAGMAVNEISRGVLLQSEWDWGRYNYMEQCGVAVFVMRVEGSFMKSMVQLSFGG